MPGYYATGNPDFEKILENASTIAIIGCSARTDRISFRNARYLQQVGFRIIPVNPNYKEVLGEVCYPNITDVPAEIKIDIVNLFRRPAETAGAVRSVLERIAKTDENPVIWTQLGVSTEEARNLSLEAGLVYISNRCLMVEHSLLS